MRCVSAAACSGSVQVLSVDPVSHFHTVRYKLAAEAMYVKRNMLVNSCNHCCSGKTTFLCVADLQFSLCERK